MDAANRLAVVDIDCLLDEIERYLGVVETFRQLGCEPRWRHACTASPTGETPLKEER